MKQKYIKPEIEPVEVKTSPMLEGSDPNTNWTVGDEPIGGGEPNPEAPAKQINLWDDWEE